MRRSEHDVGPAYAGVLRRLDRRSDRHLLHLAPVRHVQLGGDRALGRGGRPGRRAGAPAVAAAAVVPAVRGAGELHVRRHGVQRPHRPSAPAEPVPLPGRRVLPAGLPDAGGRAADLHPGALRRRQPGRVARRAAADGRAGPALVGLPDLALRARHPAGLRREGGLGRLPARRRARAGDAGPPADRGRPQAGRADGARRRRLQPARHRRPLRPAAARGHLARGRADRLGLGALLRRHRALRPASLDARADVGRTGRPGRRRRPP